MANRCIEDLCAFATSETTRAFLLKCKEDDGSITSLYFSNVEPSDGFGSRKEYGLGCLSASSDYYQSLYDARDAICRSANGQQNTFGQQLTGNDVSACMLQVKNCIYALRKPSNVGVTNLSSDVYTWLISNGKTWYDDTYISTCTFDVSAAEKILSGGEADVVSAHISSLPYNQLLEMPGLKHTDYNAGYWLANMYKCKNNYDSKYDEAYNGEKPARQYIGLFSCGKHVYLKYRECDNDGNPIGPEHVETIAALNRHDYSVQHKANMYDVDIVCEKLRSCIVDRHNEDGEDGDMQECIWNTMKLEIKNCINNICQQLSPVDTQLLRVNVYDKETELK